MRVAIDLTALLPQQTGVDVALLGLVRHLARIDRDGEYTILINREDAGLFAGGLGDRFRILPLSIRPRAARLFCQQVILPALSAALRLDVIHSPSFIMPLWRGRAEHVLTIHDMTSFSRPEYHVPLRRSRAYQRAVSLGIERAGLITVPSQWVKDDILGRFSKLAPERIRVVPWGIGEEFQPLAVATARRAVARLGLPESFVLFVGTLEPRKDVPTLIDAFAKLEARGGRHEHLVLAGRFGWGHREVLERIRAHRLEDRVRLLGYVSREDLPALYAAARVFVYPSIEEGFGFPPLEAMACGTPTIVTASSSLRENLEDAAGLVPTGDATSLAESMARLLGDEALRATRSAAGLVRARQFSWDAAAYAMHACYRELCARRAAARESAEEVARTGESQPGS